MRYFTLTQMMKELGRPRQFKLARHLINQANVTAIEVGRTWAVAEHDLPRLREALKAWENRPRVCA